MDNSLRILYALIAKHGTEWVRHRLLDATDATHVVKDNPPCVWVVQDMESDSSNVLGTFLDGGEAELFAEARNGCASESPLMELPEEVRQGLKTFTAYMGYEWGEEAVTIPTSHGPMRLQKWNNMYSEGDGRSRQRCCATLWAKDEADAIKRLDALRLEQHHANAV